MYCCVFVGFQTRNTTCCAQSVPISLLLRRASGDSVTLGDFNVFENGAGRARTWEEEGRVGQQSHHGRARRHDTVTNGSFNTFNNALCVSQLRVCAVLTPSCAQLRLSDQWVPQRGVQLRLVRPTLSPKP